MTTFIANIVVLVLIGVTAYAGYRDGLYVSLYAAGRGIASFLVAMTLFEPLSKLAEYVLGSAHPGPEYFQAASFMLVFGAVFMFCRWLKMRFTVPLVPAYAWVERAGGAILGLATGVTLTGVLLLWWSLLPFVKYLPADYGRIHTDKLLVDSGKGMLYSYDFAARRMPGGRRFLLRDETTAGGASRNRGWLWRYRTHADIRLEHLQSALKRRY